MTVGQAMDFRATAIAKGVSREQIQKGAAILATALDAIKQGERILIEVLPALNALWALVSDGRSTKELIAALESKGNVVSDWAKDIMNKPDFAQAVTSGVTYQLVGIRGDEFSEDQRTTANIYAEAVRRGYHKPPAFLAALLREKFTQEQLGHPYVAVMHEPICDSSGCPSVLGLNRGDGRGWLHAWRARPGGRWGRGDLFVFLAPQVQS
ncbi:MAG: hypothetical protein AAB864_01510 [Patescibacteria group bacterium]